jgi:HlyD family secretion protein
MRGSVRQVAFLTLTMSGLALTMVGCGKREVEVAEKPHEVSTGDISISIVETGTVDAVKSVELKPQATGRLARLLVEEGSQVVAGELVAVIDPQETELRVNQNRAQLTGAQSQVDRAAIEINQRRKTAFASLEVAKARVKQLEFEIANQPALLRAEIEQAEANLASAQAEVNRIAQSSQPTQRASAKAQLEEAIQNFENSKIELQRQTDLEAKGFVATRAVQSAQLTVDINATRVRNAQEQFDKLEAGFRAEVQRAKENARTAEVQLRRAKVNRFQIQTRNQDLRTARAEVARAEAGLADPSILQKQKIQSQASVTQLRSALQDSERQLRETQVRSPITGIVSRKLLQVGELATGLSQFGAGSTILKIEDRTKMRVKLAVNEIDVARLKLGMTTNVSVDALPGKKFTGKIMKIAPSRQEAAGAATQIGSDSVVKFEVEVVLDNAEQDLKSGMSAKCQMGVAKRKNVVFLPSEYVEKKGDEYFASFPGVAAKPGEVAKPKRVKLKVGLISTSRMEILEGVKKGDKVIKPEFTGPARKGFMQMGPDDDSGDEAAKKEEGK